MYVMTPEFGAAQPARKIDMLDFAEFVAINKFDRKGSVDALRDVAKQVQRNRNAFNVPPEQMPVFGTMASRFNDDGVTALYQASKPRLAAMGVSFRKVACRWWPPATARTRRPWCPARAPLPGRNRRHRARLQSPPAAGRPLARELQQLRESPHAAEDDATRDGAKNTVLKPGRRARGRLDARRTQAAGHVAGRWSRPTPATSTW